MQELVNRSGWVSGNAVALLITGTGERVAESHNGNASAAPLLHVEYQTGGPSNQPPGVTITAPATGTSITVGENLPFTVTATDPEDGDLAGNVLWSSTIDGPLNGGTPAATFSTTSLTEGTHTITASVTDSGGVLGSDAITVTVLNSGGTQVVDMRVAANADDAEEQTSGAVVVNSSDLELVLDASNQTVGMRFTGLPIPQGATIVNAWVQFQVDEVSTDATTLTIEGEATDQAGAFAATVGNISTRSRTAASVTWSPAPWASIGAAGPDQQTPNLAAIMQELVNRSGWVSGNAVALLITGTGKRVAESHNGNSSAAPLLHVEYQN